MKYAVTQIQSTGEKEVKCPQQHIINRRLNYRRFDVYRSDGVTPQIHSIDTEDNIQLVDTLRTLWSPGKCLLRNPEVVMQQFNKIMDETILYKTILDKTNLSRYFQTILKTRNFFTRQFQKSQYNTFQDIFQTSQYFFK